MKQGRYLKVLMPLLILLSLGCGIIGGDTLSRLGRNNGEDKAEGEPRQARRPATQPVVQVVIPTSVPADIVAEADAEELLLINLYERVNPSVVSLEVVVGNIDTEEETAPDRSQPPDENFGPFNPRGEGSGFVYDKNGYIVTNSHVVAGAAAIFVTFYNGLEFEGEIVGEDPDSDLAIIRVNAPEGILIPVDWGDSEEVAVGQRAVAIGNPFGLSGSLTTGIVSGIERNLFSLNQRFRIPEVIQTDAAINPGNSGGPLLNSQGEVIGVNSAIVPRQVGFGERSFLGVGFAVPGNLALRVIPQLIEKGYYDHPWLGIEVNDVTLEIAAEMGLEEARGALVVNVLRPNTPASEAGLVGGDTDFITRDGIPTQIGGDVIIGLEDEDINNFNDLISFLSRRGEIGKPLTMTIIRDGEVLELDITLQGRPRADELSRP